MDSEWTLLEYRPGRYVKVTPSGKYLGQATEAEARAWFARQGGRAEPPTGQARRAVPDRESPVRPPTEDPAPAIKKDARPDAALGMPAPAPADLPPPPRAEAREALETEPAPAAAPKTPAPVPSPPTTTAKSRKGLPAEPTPATRHKRPPAGPPLPPPSETSQAGRPRQPRAAAPPPRAAFEFLLDLPEAPATRAELPLPKLDQEAAEQPGASPALAVIPKKPEPPAEDVDDAGLDLESQQADADPLSMPPPPPEMPASPEDAAASPETAAPDATDRWLWVDPRQEAGYSRATFDLSGFLERAIALFREKPWSGGQKPGRLMAHPAELGDGLEQAADTLGLAVTADPKVTAGTYRLALAEEK